jgi:hypothetical protein
MTSAPRFGVCCPHRRRHEARVPTSIGAIASCDVHRHRPPACRVTSTIEVELTVMSSFEICARTVRRPPVTRPLSLARTDIRRPALDRRCPGRVQTAVGRPDCTKNTGLGTHFHRLFHILCGKVEATLGRVPRRTMTLGSCGTRLASVAPGAI